MAGVRKGGELGTEQVVEARIVRIKMEKPKITK
jgi:hypothetical protein